MTNILKIAIITAYDNSSNGRRKSGVATYTPELVLHLAEICPHCELHIIADIEGKPEVLRQGRITIHRCWKPGSRFIFPVLREVAKIKPNIIHIQHEYFLYGGPLSALLLVILTAILRLLTLLRGPRIVLTLHGVIPLTSVNKSFLARHFINFPPKLAKIAVLLITKPLILLSDKIVVHEEFQKDTLIHEYKAQSRKIVVIPHGVRPLTLLNGRRARELIGITEGTIVLHFGYLARYKGIERLILAVARAKRHNKDLKLVVAGGLHPRLYSNPQYLKWVKKTLLGAKRILKDSFHFAGYIPSEKVPAYFSAADIIVLPYRDVISSSGPLHHALSLGKPVIAPEIYEIPGLSNPGNTVDELAARILELSAKNVAEPNILSASRSRSWETVAKKTLKMYSELLNR